jgi:hypothetical protein
VVDSDGGSLAVRMYPLDCFGHSRREREVRGARLLVLPGAERCRDVLGNEATEEASVFDVTLPEAKVGGFFEDPQPTPFE